ncbi:putative disease resistance protein [Gossypium australe]|uniref:Putative disease resistance protein n=1 Tax=Gossypium australe TaxID=47621 RepID=A0A5B6UGY0_9ROSI|nr:putative disease resistance protein [Gossypium australe]
MDALKDENINMIGLWGMGGVGKTTLAREVGSQAQKLNLFDKVVIMTVSQKPNLERIQDQITQYIGFDMKNEQGKRSEQELWLRLKNEPRILIILDDIRESTNLKEKIGIPIGDDHKGCKVLLTTCRQQVCRAMDCQNVVQLGCLDDDEAWTLFEKKVGLDGFSDDSIKTPAKKIVKKYGVPLASALKGKTHHEWQATCRRLKNRRLTEIEDVNEENAYACLEASFDYLKNMETKTCFLLCSLFPKDDEIYVENLVGYAWGLELYKGMDSIKDVRSEVLASIETLKNFSLLLDCGERHVKMHDVVRQFALWITSSRKEFSFGTVETLPMDEGFKYYTAISFETDQTDELPKGVGFLYLKPLLHCGNRFAETSSKFFEGMKALQVCALNHLLISLSTFQFHMNLQTLYLIDCKLSDISMLGKLKIHFIFSLLSRSNITELPTEADDLEKLRLLDLSYCDYLQRIAPNLIQRFLNLEELYLHGCSLLKWATENTTQRESYSSLLELYLLPKLAVISLDISSEHLPDSFVFCRLSSFNFCIGIRRELRYGKKYLETCPISRSLRIDKSVDTCKQLFEDVESLQLDGVEGHPNLIPSLDLGFSKLTYLYLHWCHSMQCLIDASKQQVLITTLSNLRKLSLSGMFDLEEMCNTPQPQGFLQKLEEVIVSYYDKMQVVFSIVELRSIEQEGPSHHLCLQSPEIVEIKGCNNLKFLFPTCDANSLGKLQALKIERCFGMEEIIQHSQVSTISFQCLREVQVTEYNNLKFLFPTCVADSLGQLQTLRIESCSQLQDIIQGPKVFISMAQGLARLNAVELINLSQLKGRDRNDIVLTSPSEILSSIKLYFWKMTEKKQISNVIVPEWRGGTPISNFEELFEYSGYNLSTLRDLGLYKLTELRVIWSAPIQVEHFQNLRSLTLHNCRRLRYIFSPTIARNLPQLRILNISDCEELEQIIEKDQTPSQHHLQPICFPTLSLISIINCENLKYWFPIILADGGLPKLDQLVLRRLSKLGQVFEGDESNVSKDKEKVIHLPQLGFLELYRIPNLVSFSPVGYHFVFPSLTDLQVTGCPNITTRFSVDSEGSVHAKTQIIEALKDENINMTGLWGMGGVGKTTLAREVGSQAQKLNLFDKVVVTTVSQKPNLERIQDQIAQYIGFDTKNE